MGGGTWPLCGLPPLHSFGEDGSEWPPALRRGGQVPGLAELSSALGFWCEDTFLGGHNLLHDLPELISGAEGPQTRPFLRPWEVP